MDIVDFYFTMIMECHLLQDVYKRQFLLYHFHIADPIRFENKFRMTLDNMGWTGPRYDDYTSVAYWYQKMCIRDSILVGAATLPELFDSIKLQYKLVLSFFHLEGPSRTGRVLE